MSAEVTSQGFEDPSFLRAVIAILVRREVQRASGPMMGDEEIVKITREDFDNIAGKMLLECEDDDGLLLKIIQKASLQYNA